MPLAAPVSISPLIEGDTLSSSEFLRRWEEMPDLKHAELIGGIVYMPSPVSLTHSEAQPLLAGLLMNYVAATPGCQALLEPTALLEEGEVPQPDLVLRILPEYGGNSWNRDGYLAGPPELVIEVAASSHARDLGVKKRLYERVGVREYVIVLAGRRQISWFESENSEYRLMQPGSDGIFRSGCYPGLWLDPEAVWRGDAAGLLETVGRGISTPEHAEFVARLARARDATSNA